MAVMGDLALNFGRFTVKEPIFSSKKMFFGVPILTSGVCFSGRNQIRKGELKLRVRSVMQMGVESAEVSKDSGSFLEASKGLERSSGGVFGYDVVSEAELREKGFLGLRKTKLVCTIGPACCSLESLEKLALGGMNVARINMCHNTREWMKDVIAKIKVLNQEKGYCVSVMIDTEGSQMHIVDHGSPSSVKVEDGSIWYFTDEKFVGLRPFTVQANYEGFSEGIKVGDEIIIDGGMATFEVVEKVGNDLRCKCTDPGLFLPRAKLSFWRDGKLIGKNDELPTLSTKDWSDVEFGISEGVDFIAMSFVKDADAVVHLKDYISTKTSKPIQVLAKIESLEALRNLDEIVRASDGIMIARGAFGVEVPIEQIPTVQ